jgi:hypothetical protein
MKIITYLILQLCMIGLLVAGDRGCKIGIVDISQGAPTKESKRLFELLEMDAREIYTKGVDHEFAWRKDESVIKKLEPGVLGVFEPMIIVKNQESLAKVIQEEKLSDGLIVFEYDRGAMQARLKLFDYDGTELALIKLPLEKDGAMKDSLFKHVRHASIVALGHYVRFVP